MPAKGEKTNRSNLSSAGHAQALLNSALSFCGASCMICEGRMNKRERKRHVQRNVNAAPSACGAATPTQKKEQENFTSKGISASQ